MSPFELLIVVAIIFALRHGGSPHGAFSPDGLLIARFRSVQIGLTLAIKTEERGRIHWTKVSIHTLVAGKGKLRRDGRWRYAVAPR